MMEKKTLALSHNIKYLRKSHGWNQEELASKLNIKRSNIAAYETKNVEPRLRSILGIAKLYDIDLSTLLNTKLSDGLNYKPFKAEQAPERTEIQLTSVKQKDLTEFIDKSMKIKKVLVGFKSVYAFKKSNLSKLGPVNERTIHDIDNFIQLMEHLITHNETMVNVLTNSK